MTEQSPLSLPSSDWLSRHTAQDSDSFVFGGRRFRVAQGSDVTRIRLLVNSAYKELADMGLNYTATYQDEATTLKRISKGRAFLLEEDGLLIATALLTTENWFTARNSAYISQLAVLPEMKKQRVGTLLMDLCESLAIQEGFESIQLDTAKPAAHLVSWYLKRGYGIVGETQWEGKTYESWIFEKLL